MIISFEASKKGDNDIIYCETLNVNGIKYEQRVEICDKEIISWNCDCEFGSTWRFSEKYEGVDKRCRHTIEVLELCQFLGYLNTQF